MAFHVNVVIKLIITCRQTKRLEVVLVYFYYNENTVKLLIIKRNK